jgi:hypothetical protein
MINLIDVMMAVTEIATTGGSCKLICSKDYTEQATKQAVEL